MKMTSVSIAKQIGESERAFQVIYTHFENPMDFAIVWLPKKLTTADGIVWQIPMWLKNKIAVEARRYNARPFQNGHGMPDYGYGFGPYYDNSGRDVSSRVAN